MKTVLTRVPFAGEHSILKIDKLCLSLQLIVNLQELDSYVYFSFLNGTISCQSGSKGSWIWRGYGVLPPRVKETYFGCRFKCIHFKWCFFVSKETVYAPFHDMHFWSSVSASAFGSRAGHVSVGVMTFREWNDLLPFQYTTNTLHYRTVMSDIVCNFSYFEIIRRFGSWMLFRHQFRRDKEWYSLGPVSQSQSNDRVWPSQTIQVE
jgi:hypothetical protein